MHLDGLEGISIVPGDLEVRYCYFAENIQGLQNISHVGNRLIVNNMRSIDNLLPLSNLSYVGSDVILESMYLITSLDGLEGLDHINGALHLKNLVEVTDISGLTHIRYTKGQLFIAGMQKLQDLSPLSQLDSIGGKILLQSNRELRTLNGLHNIRKIQGELELRSNRRLNNISALKDIDHTTITRVVIENSDSLSMCHIESVCRYLEDPERPTRIHTNKEGCKDPEQIRIQCPTSSLSDHDPTQSNLILYPNPASGDLWVHYLGTIHATHFQIRGMDGRLYMRQAVNSIDPHLLDIHLLPSGIYLVEAMNNEYVLNRAKVMVH
jgi:hypothetical protein